MKSNENLLYAIGHIDDNAILDINFCPQNAYKTEFSTFTKKKPRRLPKAVLTAACLCLLIAAASLFSPNSGMTIAAYAYGSEQEISATGAVMSTGSINADGVLTGHPLMFFLQGSNIDTVRFSCRNQKINFMDWTEKRDEFGNAQNFTVSYGEDENEYYFLLIDWVPEYTIRHLSENKNTDITSLPAKLREDIIAMEITFDTGEKLNKAIYISLQDDGSFFASLGDFITNADADFLNRPDAEAIPRAQLYGITTLDISFLDSAGNSIAPEANWYNAAGIESISVKWEGAIPDEIRMYYTPSGSETAEKIELFETKIPTDGSNEIILDATGLQQNSLLGHLQIEAYLGGKTTSAQFNIIYGK